MRHRLSDTAADPADRLPLSLSPDEKTALKKATRKVQEHLGMLPFFLDGPADEAMTREKARIVLETVESGLADLGRQLGVDTEAAAAIEQRYGELRVANTRIRELEALLGQQMPVEAIQPALYSMERRLRDWWKLEGLGHVSEVRFNAYSLQVTLSTQMISGRPQLPGAEHLSHAERRALWLASLEHCGFVLIDDDGKCLRDCGSSRDALRKLIGGRLPGAKISQFISREGDVGSVLTGVEVYIYDLAAVQVLPVPEPKTPEVDADA